jgi:hypothetical protein
MSNVIQFRRKPQPIEEERVQLKPLREEERSVGDDFAERMQRIRSSLEKINQLMWEFKNSH